VQADSQPVHFDTTNPASRAPAVYQAGRQNHADLTASGVGRPTGPAPTPPPSDSAGNKAPTRLVLNLQVPPGCNPVVLVMDGPPTYYLPTKNNVAANLEVTKTKDGTYETVVRGRAARQEPTIYKVGPKE
jgi:hypothetical protein